MSMADVGRLQMYHRAMLHADSLFGVYHSSGVTICSQQCAAHIMGSQSARMSHLRCHARLVPVTTGDNRIVLIALA